MNLPATPHRLPGLRRSRRLFKALVLLMLLALAVGVAGFAAYRWSLAASIAELRAHGKHRLDLYAGALEREIAHYATVPGMLGLDRELIELLRDETTQLTPERVKRANLFLERLNARTGSQAIYVMNERGLVLSSSNWQQPNSFVGQNFSYRPYFSSAIQGKPGRFYGVGTTSGEPGYYLSYGVAADERWIGVAAIKIGLDRLEQTWRGSETPVLLSDEIGVVILSSIPAWKFGALKAIPPATLAELAQSRRYNARPIPPLGLETLADDDGLQRVELSAQRARELAPSAANAATGDPGEYIVQSRALESAQWTLSVFADTRPARELAINHAALAGVLAAFLVFLLLMDAERRRLLQERLAAREALQQAHDELERKVAQRTAELSDSIAKLEAEVAERARAEQTLREAQAGLVQAGKLAVIGQLAAGITHELNQPLVALRTLSGNTIKYLERGKLDTVRSNLQTIDELSERMGTITGQLKRFARKSTGYPQNVSIARAIASALFLMDQRIRKQKAEIHIELQPEQLMACGDQNRLEQVLVNLIGNALDAMQDTPDGPPPRLELRGEQQDERVVLRVIDNGPGLPPHVRARLFEPFFTTKEAGVGLGLGLAISAGIVREFGGKLGGDNLPQGGAVFVIDLPAAKETQT